jgi:hypothetical protein
MIRILILGVNPFEDLPGFQLLGLLRSRGKFELIAADDSAPALNILSLMGAHVELLPQPTHDPLAFTRLVAGLCDRHDVSVLLPGTDAHLYALASCLSEEPQLGLLCPTLEWLAARRLMNKWDLQSWASRFANTPSRWSFDTEAEATAFAERAMYPLMIKGLRKGAIRADDSVEAVVSRRALLRNPVNQGPGGGTYCETFVDGAERSFLLLSDGAGRRLASFGLRKLAATQLGTTVAAEVDDTPPQDLNTDAVIAEVSSPIVFELEWRQDHAGRQWLFEINVRFPSWVGALGDYGAQLVEAHVLAVRGDCDNAAQLCPPPNGSVFYRLPQSGFLNVEAAFGPSRTSARRNISTGTQNPLLWKSASPHQFRVK